MSSEKRVKFREIDKNILYQQVQGICPLCQQPLYYEKNGQREKLYELAHIYPLNPSQKEEQLLINEPKLFITDCNEINNIIPLCSNCHTKQDKPITIESYRTLFAIKSKLIEKEKIVNMYSSYPMEEELIEIVDKISSYNDIDNLNDNLDYTLKSVDAKIPDEKVLNRKVKFDVSQYYLLLKALFADSQKMNPNCFELIANQVKSFYLGVSKVSMDKSDIYNHIASWMHEKFKVGSIDAYKIIVSFFVQDCEVFSDVAE